MKTTALFRTLLTGGILLTLLCCCAAAAFAQANAPVKKVWDKTYGGDTTDVIYAMLELEDGGFLFGGYSVSDSGIDKSEDARSITDFWIVKIAEFTAGPDAALCEPGAAALNGVSPFEGATYRYLAEIRDANGCESAAELRLR